MTRFIVTDDKGRIIEDRDVAEPQDVVNARDLLAKARPAIVRNRQYLTASIPPPNLAGTAAVRALALESRCSELEGQVARLTRQVNALIMLGLIGDTADVDGT